MAVKARLRVRVRVWVSVMARISVSVSVSVRVRVRFRAGTNEGSPHLLSCFVKKAIRLCLNTRGSTWLGRDWEIMGDVGR